MKVFVKVFANLRDYIHPKPAIGEKIELDVKPGTTVRELIKRLGIPEDQVAIVFVDGVGKSLDYALKKEGTNISLFSPVGGG